MPIIIYHNDLYALYFFCIFIYYTPYKGTKDIRYFLYTIKYIFVIYLFYAQQFVSLNFLPLSCPSDFSLPIGNDQFVLYICKSLFIMLYSFVLFYRFYILVLAYGICLCLTYFTNIKPYICAVANSKISFLLCMYTRNVNHINE